MRLRILFLFSIIIVSSCSTTTKISVVATPGTEIMTPDKRVLAVADETGKAEFINNDDNYYSFLLTHEKESSMYVPFALNYKHKKYGTATAAWIDFGAMFVGMGGMLANENNDTPRMIFGGVSLAALGAFFPLLGKCAQTNESYQYKYLPLQISNQDIPFAPIDYYPSNSVQKLSSNNSSTESVNIQVSSDNISLNNLVGHCFEIIASDRFSYIPDVRGEFEFLKVFDSFIFNIGSGSVTSSFIYAIKNKISPYKWEIRSEGGMGYLEIFPQHTKDNPTEILLKITIGNHEEKHILENRPYDVSTFTN